MTEQTVKPYLGLSKLERSAKRRTVLIEAALVLSDELGWKHVTIDRLCQHAQLNKRYFYENFIDINDFYAKVVDYVAEDIIKNVAQSLQGSTHLAEMAYLTLDRFIRFVTAVPARARLIFGELSTTDHVAIHRKRLVQQLVQEVTRHAREIHQAQQLEHSIIENSALFLIGGTGQVILNWLDQPQQQDLAQVIQDLTHLWLMTGNATVAYVRETN